ncbi:OpcA protein [Bifidobacterium thermophilum]|uniref:OpcA protein n=1 Tax=Bifidobacterium thermophilum TaxID=33905 RepID=A0A2N3QP13_9BIFI|nr:glucose-6-phosphate dehydrogenase assembly protein OpcA [Bifidobacterium thermophilum]PKU93400.1 OpcA protein [Bifidobacterium thermophilum]
MIIDLPNTRTREISAKIDELHEERGESATGRVLTLLIRTDDAELENSLEVANAASREHPCRVIAIVPNTHASIVSGEGEATSESENAADESNLDAQVRFGADAGAGEVIVLRPRNGLVDHLDTLVIPLLVPDAPVVAWWPTNPPSNPSKDLLGAMASSRITDAMRSSNPEATIERLRRNWSAQDVDLSWTRLTVWRAMLASMVDQPPHIPIVRARVTAPSDFLPADLLRAWLRLKLNVPVDFDADENAEAVTGVYLTREDGGVLSLERPHEDQSIISVPGQTPQPISVPVRTLEDCLTEELRRMDPDEVYADVINKGWDLIWH